MHVGCDAVHGQIANHGGPAFPVDCHLGGIGWNDRLVWKPITHVKQHRAVSIADDNPSEVLLYSAVLRVPPEGGRPGEAGVQGLGKLLCAETVNVGQAPSNFCDAGVATGR